MLRQLLTGCFLFALCLAVQPLNGNPVDLSAPTGELGAADPHGFLEIWREVEGAGVELGKGSYLPLRYRFSSETDGQGALGPGFHVPMFESRNVLIRERTMQVNLPCGKKLFLWRDAADANKFQSPDKEWSGTLEGDNFALSRPDGWKLLYRQSRLAAITSDQGTVFDWSYDSAGGGSVSRDGQSVVSMEAGLGGRIAAFVCGDKTYKAEYGKRPIIQSIAGQSLVKGAEAALSRLQFPDSRSQTFDFGLTADHQPTLAAKEADGSSTEYRWNSTDRHLAAENGPQGSWEYDVGKITEELGTPLITRTNPHGQTEAILANRTGKFVEQALDGSRTITYTFNTPGPLYGKLQKIERVEQTNGREVTTLQYKASYDEAGRLLRQFDGRGVSTSYQYDEQGRVKGKTLNVQFSPEVLEELRKKEADLLERIASTTFPPRADAFSQELAFLYIEEFKD